MARLAIASICFTALLVLRLPGAVFSESKASTHEKGEITIDKKGNDILFLTLLCSCAEPS